MRPALEELRAAVQGRWFEVLTAIGLPTDSLTRRNKPCPACGGTDRFSFTDRKGSGSFVCRALERQGGDGFELVQHWLGCDFPAALEAVAKALGRDGGAVTAARARPRPQPSPKPQPVARHRRDAGADLRRLWHEARPLCQGDAADRYLTARGLALSRFPAVLRLHPSLPYWITEDGQTRLLGSFSAILAAVQGPDFRTVALHRTYLSPLGGKLELTHPYTGQPLPARKLKTRGDGVMPGAACRLFDPVGGRLAVCEGIETGLAVHQACGIPVWACLSAGGLSSVVLTPLARQIYIAADNDEHGAGMRAAQALAGRLEAEGRQVEILAPSTPGMDWLDVLNATAKEAA